MEFHVGDEVIFTMHYLHEIHPNAFPPGGTSGIVTRLVGARPSYAEVLFGEFECFVKIESIAKKNYSITPSVESESALDMFFDEY